MSAPQVPPLKHWAIQVNWEVQNLSINRMENPLWNKQSIYKMPHGFGNPKHPLAYKPQVVSFGPYHHGEEDRLKPVEEHKHRVFVHFLKRAGKSAIECVAKVHEVVQQLMDSYDQLGEEWKDRDKFLKMMIHDGCFMIEIFRIYSPKAPNSPDLNDYAFNDPIFSGHAKFCKLPNIKRDMLVIGNQLPLLLLKTLLGFEGRYSQDDEYINQLVMNFFHPNPSNTKMGQCLHVLDVVRKSMLSKPLTDVREESSHPDTLRITREESRRRDILPTLTTEESRHPDTSMQQIIYQKLCNLCGLAAKSEHGKYEVIWPATQLDEARIRFKISNTKGIIDMIKFENDTLSLPQIEVDDATASKFLNLMAFELLHGNAGSEVCSYVSFMDKIIDSERDVILLNKERIIKNFVGTDQAVAELFNGLAYDVPTDPNSTPEVVSTKVMIYCNTYFRRMWAEFVRTHFRYPWSYISPLAAFVLLILTIIQTVFTILH